MFDRPNVLLIITDQQSASAMSCAGNSEVHTPAADSLARDGIRFTRAYCASPTCAASRNSMMTGRMPHEHSFTGGYLSDPGSTLGRVLNDSGYECYYAGNRSFSLQQDPEECGFDALCPPPDALVAEESARFLAERAAGESEAPFFLVSSFINPHNIYQWVVEQNTYLGDIDERPIPDCPPLPANHAIAPYTPQAIRAYLAGQTEAWPTPQNTEDPNWWRRYLNAYYRMVEMVDSQVGQVLYALRRSGLYDNTLVIYLSDHGDAQAAHKWKFKNVLYEEAIRIPFVIKPPAVTQHRTIPVSNRGAEGVVIADFVSSGLDLFPTLCDYAGIEPHAGLIGSSLRPFVERARGIEATYRWRKQLVVSTDRVDMRMVGRAVFEDPYKYVVYDWGHYREQLFDLRADPGEMVNLASNAEYAERLNHMRTFLRGWCAGNGDTFSRRIPLGSAPAPI